MKIGGESHFLIMPKALQPFGLSHDHRISQCRNELRTRQGVQSYWQGYLCHLSFYPRHTAQQSKRQVIDWSRQTLLHRDRENSLQADQQRRDQLTCPPTQSIGGFYSFSSEWQAAEREGPTQASGLLGEGSSFSAVLCLLYLCRRSSTPLTPCFRVTMSWGL